MSINEFAAVLLYMRVYPNILSESEQLSSEVNNSADG